MGHSSFLWRYSFFPLEHFGRTKGGTLSDDIYLFGVFEKGWWWVFLGAGSIPQFFRDTLFLFSASGLVILWSLYLCEFNLSFSLFRRKLLDAYSIK